MLEGWIFMQHYGIWLFTLTHFNQCIVFFGRAMAQRPWRLQRLACADGKNVKQAAVKIWGAAALASKAVIQGC